MPSAQPAQALTASEALVPVWLLEDGEIVILAIKPSPFFVILASAPMIALAAVAALGSYLAGNLLDVQLMGQTMGLLALLAAAMRMVVALLQWLGRLYVLTNRRIMRLRGAIRVDVFQSPLQNIQEVALLTTMPERILGNIGSLFFGFPDDRDTGWLFISRPAEVKQIIEETLSNARKLRRRANGSEAPAQPTDQA